MREGGKALARCTDCGDVFIVRQHDLDNRLGVRPIVRGWRLVAAMAGAFVSLLLAGADLLLGVGIPWRIALLLAALFAVLKPVEVLMLHTWSVNRRIRWLPERISGAIIVLVFVAVLFGLTKLILWTL